MNSDYDPKGIDSGRLYEAREAARNQQRSVDQLTREVKHLAKRVAALEESQPGNIRPANWPAVFVRQAASHDAELRSAVTAESARPIRLSERKPDLEECHCIPNSTAKDGAYIWAGSIIQAVGLDSFWNWDLVGRDYMITHSSSGRGATLYTHWLPASTKYLPARVDQ